VADTKTSALSALTGVNVDTAADVLEIVDTSVTTSKKILIDELRIALGIATQAQQETATSLVTTVTPGRQQYHPSAAKAWALYDSAGGLTVSYNCTSVTRNGAGNNTLTWTTSFSSGNYAIVAMVLNATTPYFAQVLSQAAGSCNIVTLRASDFVQIDVTGVFVIAFGDQ